MNKAFIEGREFVNQSFENTAPNAGTYEDCTFINCDFSDSVLSDITFVSCEFRECNLSLSKLIQTTFREVEFKGSKLLGLHFEDCNNLLISFRFEGCLLELCSFTELKIKKTVFRDSKVFEADFTDADLSGSSFVNCDLQRTVFSNTNLEGADFRSSFNYSIDPEANRIRKAKFSLNGVPGLLGRYDIDIEK